MILYVNDNFEVKDVNTTEDLSLKALHVNDEENPLADWSIAKICCYKVKVTEDGRLVSFSPYIDPKIIDHIDKLSAEAKLNSDEITNSQLAVAELYEMMTSK